MKKEIDGVKVDAKSIITSLKIIKTVCEDNGTGYNCGECPFCVNDVCAIIDLEPCNWKISEYSKWQALL